LAAFLDIQIDPTRPAMLEHCSIDHMRKLAARSEILPQIFKEGGNTPTRTGSNGRWHDVLTGSLGMVKAPNTSDQESRSSTG